METEKFSSEVRDVFPKRHLLDALEEAIATTSALRRESVGQSDLSPVAKIPFKVEVLNQACLRRILDLANACVRDVNAGALAPAFLNARAALETMFSALDISMSVSDATQQHDKSGLQRLDERIMKGLVGSKSEDWGGKEVPAVNILTIVDRFAKKIDPAIARMYADLSEHAHPNWAGTVGAYSRIEKVTGRVHFIDSPLFKAHEKIGFPVGATTIALTLMAKVISSYAKDLPSFVLLCEEELHDQGKWPDGAPYPRSS